MLKPKIKGGLRLIHLLAVAHRPLEYCTDHLALDALEPKRSLGVGVGVECRQEQLGLRGAARLEAVAHQIQQDAEVVGGWPDSETLARVAPQLDLVVEDEEVGSSRTRRTIEGCKPSPRRAPQRDEAQEHHAPP